MFHTYLWCKHRSKNQYDVTENLLQLNCLPQPKYLVNKIVGTWRQLDMYLSWKIFHGIFVLTTFAQMHRLIQCWLFLLNLEISEIHLHHDLFFSKQIFFMLYYCFNFTKIKRLFSIIYLSCRSKYWSPHQSKVS